MSNNNSQDPHEKAAQHVLAQFTPEIRTLIKDHARLYAQHQLLLAKQTATLEQYRSLHAAMIVVLKRAPERTIRLELSDFQGVLFDEYVIQLHEDAPTKDLVLTLVHKSEVQGGVEFEMPAEALNNEDDPRCVKCVMPTTPTKQ